MNIRSKQTVRRLIGFLFSTFLLAATASEQPGSQPKSVQRTVWSEVPFSLDQENLPLGFTGHDSVRLLRAAMKLPVKGTYETTAEYAVRLQAARDKPVYGTVSLNDLLAFSFFAFEGATNSAFGHSYNADTSELTYFIKESRNYSTDTCDIHELDTVTRKGKSYVGQNAFGVKRNIAVIHEKQLIFGVRCDSDSLYSSGFNVNWSFQLDREQASELKKIIVIGRVMQPAFKTEENFYEPTLSSPVAGSTSALKLVIEPSEVWLTDGLGKVFHKGKL